jgi:hypothetical protein
MKHYIKITKDSTGNNYLAIDLEYNLVEPFLNQLQEILGESFEQYTKLQQVRDMGKYHITIMTVSEFNHTSKQMGFDKFTNQLQHLLKVGFDDIRFLGIGSSEKSENTAYYIVLESELLDEVRNKLNLDPKDFHVTLGFKWKDVYGVPKNKVIKTNQTFLTKLKYLYMNEGGTFEFVKGLTNFDYDFFKQIEPIEINETNAKFRCGMNDYFQVSLIDNKLFITAKWQDTNQLPILANTLVEKKFKQIQ